MIRSQNLIPPLRSTLAAVVLTAATISLQPTSGHAFALFGQRWTSGQAIMNNRLGPCPGPFIGYGGSCWEDVSNGALAEWNRVGASFEFRIYDPTQSADLCNANDQTNTVGWAGSLCGQGFGGAIAVTRRVWAPDGLTMLNADVLFDLNRSWNAYPGDLQPSISGDTLYDFYRVALHEFGHVAGLDHPDEHGQSVAAVMNSIVSNIDHLQPDDQAGLRALGGGGTVCSPGASEGCYTGPAGTENVGICHGGSRTCRADGSGYGECAGQVTPQSETCNNGQDDNCNGSLDDGCQQPSQSTLQITPDGSQVMIQKDYGSERWSITYEPGRGTYLGNVFKADGSPASFVACNTISSNADAIDFSCYGADACRDAFCPGSRVDGQPDWLFIATQTLPRSFFEPRANIAGEAAVPASGAGPGGVGVPAGGGGSTLQISNDGSAVMIQKDYGSERWSITYQPASGIYLGNVFKSDGSPPSFIWCSRFSETATDISFTCQGADACRSNFCPGSRPDGRPDWVYIGDQTLPRSFFEPRQVDSGLGCCVSVADSGFTGCSQSITESSCFDLGAGLGADWRTTYQPGVDPSTCCNSNGCSLCL